MAPPLLFYHYVRYPPRDNPAVPVKPVFLSTIYIMFSQIIKLSLRFVVDQVSHFNVSVYIVLVYVFVVDQIVVSYTI